MKARLSLDQYCDITKVTPELQPLVSWVPGKDSAGKPTLVAMYLEGCIFEGDIALQLCRTGQAAPADEECALALGKSAAELARLQIEYKMNAMGINNKDDRELYRAGVIAGYEKDGTYKPGPNWAKYKEAQAKLEESEV